MPEGQAPNPPPEITRKATAARPADADRGLIRLDPGDIEILRCRPGAAVSITGPGGTVYARALPQYAEHRGQGTVQLDGGLREGCGAALGESVTLAVVATQPAERITLNAGAAVPPAVTQAVLLHSFDGMPVDIGQPLRLRLSGGALLPLRVTGTHPAGPVIVGPQTRLQVSGGRRPPPEAPADAGGDSAPRLTYEDVGGLGPALQRVRETIEWPLRRADLFGHLGIAPPKGVLLCGPPGTGKTLIARAVAAETEARFFHINGPEIVDRFYGASEAQLRKLFDQARAQAPAIVFIDELDAIAPKRDALAGDRQVERRIVAQLLTLMDGLQDRGAVMVIAATNMPDSLDPALRRPGRFDREITIGVPDTEGRREILDIHTRGMPIARDVDLSALARRTHGYVGADLAALAREAAMAAARRAMGTPADDPAGIAALTVTAPDFDRALAATGPSALREVFTERPATRWSDVAGLDTIRQRLVEAVIWPLNYAERMQQAGIRPARGVLLHGPPGSGKTLLVRALAGEADAAFITLSGPSLLSRWQGEAEKALDGVFAKARHAAPCLLFLDEIDAIAPARGSGDSATVERLVTQFLIALDGFTPAQGVVLIGATNRPERVDPALLRPGRFDVSLAVPLPDEAGRAAILDLHLARMPVAPAIDIRGLAARTEGYSGADLADLCRRAGMAALRETIGAGPDAALSLSADHLETALSEREAA